MSTKENSVMRPFATHTGLTPFNPEKFNLNEELLYCASSPIPGAPVRTYPESSTNQPGLSGTEQKLIKQRLLQYFVASKQTEPFVQVDKSRVVLKDVLQDSPSSLNLNALVICWNGRGYPPEGLCFENTQNQNLEFKRVYHDKATAARERSLRFHWSSVLILKDSNPDLEKNWNFLAEKCGSKDFVVHFVPGVVATTTFTLPQLLAQARGADSVTARRSHEVAQALLQNEDDSEDHQTVHGHRVFSKDEDLATSILGLELMPGESRKLSLNASEPPLPLVQRSSVSRLFLPEGSVADSLNEYLGSAGNEKIKRITDLTPKLRGKYIQFQTKFGRIEKPIHEVPDLVSAAITNRDDMHPYWRSKIEMSLRYPNFPCIDVGSRYKRALIPMEMCSFLPGQSFKSIMTPTIAKAIAVESVADIGSSPDDLVVKQIGIVPSSNDEPKEVRRNKLDTAIGKAFQEGAIVHFAEAGISSETSMQWSNFKKSLHSARSFKGSSINFASNKPLVLRFQPGKDASEIWRQQLKDWKSANHKPGEKDLLVIAVRSDRYHSQIYRTIKYLADIEVGIQVYFVKIETLEQKVEKNPRKGIEMAMNEVVRRMALRNPIDPPVSFDAVQDVAVSMHTGRVHVEVPKMGTAEQHTEASQTQHLLVFSSRDVEKSTGHRTSSELINFEHLTANRLKERLVKFLEADQNININKDLRHRVTVLRSGFIPNLQKTAVDSYERDVKRYLEEDVIHRNMFPPGLNDLALKNEVINSEVSAFTKAVKETYGSSSSMSYVLLSEDKDFTFSHDAKKTIAKQVEEQTGKPRFFITDTKANPDINTIGAHQQVQMQNRASMITLTLLGERLSDQQAVSEQKLSSSTEASSNSSGQDSAYISGLASRTVSPAKKSGFSTSLTGSDSDQDRQQLVHGNHNSPELSDSEDELAPLMPLTARKKLTAPKIPATTIPLAASALANLSPPEVSKVTDTPPANISIAELQRLAKLWVDDHLDLYETKWPVPTHLAHLACKRAQMHLRKNNIVGEDTDHAKFVLGRVHEDVEKTLYFL